MTRFLDHRLQFLAGMKSHHATGADRNLFARLRVAAGTLRLVPELEIAEAGEFHALAALEGAANLLEEGFDHVFGLTLVQADLLEKEVGQLGLRQSHCDSLNPFYVRRVAENFRPRSATSSSRAASASASVRVLSVCCITTRNARLFPPAAPPSESFPPW